MAPFIEYPGEYTRYEPLPAIDRVEEGGWKFHNLHPQFARELLSVAIENSRMKYVIMFLDYYTLTSSVLSIKERIALFELDEGSRRELGTAEWDTVVG